MSNAVRGPRFSDFEIALGPSHDHVRDIDRIVSVAQQMIGVGKGNKALRLLAAAKILSALSMLTVSSIGE
ncbi:MAG: hypothetical protein J2P54_26490 [Bradyrhizobiaceae bacterium]|nr:hypothetical protein [Bradyrhizobiaceae bacterium]